MFILSDEMFMVNIINYMVTLQARIAFELYIPESWKNKCIMVSTKILRTTVLLKTRNVS